MGGEKPLLIFKATHTVKECQYHSCSSVMCSGINSTSEFVYIPSPPLEESSIIELQHLETKSVAIRRQTFHNWLVQFIDKNHLAAASFYYIYSKDVLCCAFCVVQVSQWEEGDDPFKEHQRWSPSCGYIKGLFVGNNPIGSTDQVPTRSRIV